MSDAFAAYEAVLTRAFERHPVEIICGYDTREQSPEMLEWARRTHPDLFSPDGLSPNPAFRDASENLRELTPEPRPVPDLPTVPLDGDTKTFRTTLRALMDGAGIPPNDATGMLLAAAEVLDNARRYGGGAPRARAGAVGSEFVVEISDSGPGLDDPGAGYLPPRPDGTIGTGLWLARQFTERLDLVSSPDGLTVRLWV
jgi:anti-sigma regulatory factor (Ser/Thr protein kinase)